jgi:hypothetical protein
MGKSKRSVTELARAVAELQDQSPGAKLDRERGRARLMSADLSLKQRASSPPRWVALIAATLAAASFALAFFLMRPPRRAMEFELGAVQSGVVGDWIAAPPSAELPIRFTDGSLLKLAPSGRARVVAVTDDGAEVALERGALDLSVVHREHTRWLVRVGPFRIHVIGTRFEVAWDPVTERLSVALREGAITLSGPVVGESRAVRTGERLTVSMATNSMESSAFAAATTMATPVMAVPTGASDAPPAVPSSSASSGVAPITNPSSPHPSSHVAVKPAPDATEPDWAQLAREAKYKEALAAAERQGFDAICSSATARELHALGDAARLGGSAARSTQAFKALRARFAGTPEAASAAFLLGRVAQDQSHDDAAALALYTQYLSEAPGGAFAADAQGRMVEVADRMGDHAAARRAATRYLASYPNGAHAAFAKSVLDRGGAVDLPAAPGANDDAPKP